MLLLDVAALASEQWGLVTTAQAAEVGVSPKMMARWAKDGSLERLAHGVYKLAGTAYDPREDLRVAWLTLEPQRTAAERISTDPIDAVVSHRSAARLHELGDLEADRYQFTVEGRKQSRRPDVRIRRRSEGIDRDSWTLVGGLPVTTVMTTIVDLAADGTDGGHLAGVVRDAISTASVDLAKLSEALRPYAHRYGVQTGDGLALLRRFLDEAPLPQTTVQAAELMRDTGPATAMGRSPLPDPALLRTISELSTDPELRRTIETISTQQLRQKLNQVQDALAALRRTAQ
ncbi:type IV toxin-antitoxin system AbiEi family antitoxin domain-containing protein [Kribbella sp. CA-294648]|uniref:type IV toxin-antitoxin system AbiEi family antitoxin domain-containing protein n=1 Tax=Kribbella sp. CA-294648 TaxID=3239948 RepID=UPI003D8B2157